MRRRCGLRAQLPLIILIMEAANSHWPPQSNWPVGGAQEVERAAARFGQSLLLAVPLSAAIEIDKRVTIDK